MAECLSPRKCRSSSLLQGASTVLLVSALLLKEAQCRIATIPKSSGEECEMLSGVLGRCEEVSSCKRSRGVETWNDVLHVCTGGPDDGRTYVCCRKPFEVARQLCNSWRDYWRDNGGKCVAGVPLIVGGERAVVGQFPVIAVLGYHNRRRTRRTWVCGGTLVSPHFVLTAAHCVLRTKKYVLRFGQHDLYNAEDANISRIVGSVPLGLYGAKDIQFERRNKVAIEQTVDVQKVIIHPHYDQDYYNDIALLLLDRPVVLTKRVLPACLPLDPEESFMNSLLTVAGWGRLSYNSNALSRILQKVQIPIIPQKKCFAEFRKKSLSYAPGGILASQMCVGAEEKNACAGDSGGPLIVQVNDTSPLKPCEHTVAGIVSFGYGCGELSVYTRVSSYVDWITGYIAPKVKTYA